MRLEEAGEVSKRVLQGAMARLLTAAGPSGVSSAPGTQTHSSESG